MSTVAPPTTRVSKGFSVNFSGSYIDAYYTYVNPLTEIPQAPLPDGTVVPGDPLSAKLPKTPKYKLSLFPQYDYSLPNDATVRVLADYTCETLCGPVISIVSDALAQSGLRPGVDYRLIAVGLDPKDTAADAAQACLVFFMGVFQ